MAASGREKRKWIHRLPRLDLVLDKNRQTLGIVIGRIGLEVPSRRNPGARNRNAHAGKPARPGRLSDTLPAPFAPPGLHSCGCPALFRNPLPETRSRRRIHTSTVEPGRWARANLCEGFASYVIHRASVISHNDTRKASSPEFKFVGSANLFVRARAEVRSNVIRVEQAVEF
jgi:hypothetical protein